MNNRMVLNGLLGKLGLSDRAVVVLRALDKLGKIGPDRVVEEMVAVAGATDEQARAVVNLSQLEGDNDAVLCQVDALVAGSETGEEGVAKLREILSAVAAVGVPAERVRIDLSIARGLDYYTGTIFETFLNDLPTIGSICSGGRYDNLAELYTNQELPGIGASLGLDRLLAAMEELGMIQKIATPAPVFIPYFDKDRLQDYLRLAAALRAGGLGVEIFPEPKKLGQQLKYADRRGFRVALIAGQNEFDAGVCQVKDLRNATREDVPLEANAASIIAAVHKILGS